VEAVVETVTTNTESSSKTIKMAENSMESGK
jgi:hypothetical protein